MIIHDQASTAIDTSQLQKRVKSLWLTWSKFQQPNQVQVYFPSELQKAYELAQALFSPRELVQKIRN